MKHSVLPVLVRAIGVLGFEFLEGSLSYCRTLAAVSTESHFDLTFCCECSLAICSKKVKINGMPTLFP
jgi:hypothetical protein